MVRIHPKIGERRRDKAIMNEKAEFTRSLPHTRPRILSSLLTKYRQEQ